MFDLTSRESFNAIAAQISNYIDYSPTNSARNIVLVANKVDLAAEKRHVSFQEAEELAKKLGLAGFIETSAKEGLDSLTDAFYIAAVNAVDIRDSDSMASKGRSRFNSDQP